VELPEVMIGGVPLARAAPVDRDAYALAQAQRLAGDPAHRALLARAQQAQLAVTPGGSLAGGLREAADEAGRLAGVDNPAASLLRDAAAAADAGDWGKAAGNVALVIKTWTAGPPAGPAGESPDWSGWLALRTRLGRLATALRRRRAKADPAAPPVQAVRSAAFGCDDPLCKCGPKAARRARSVTRAVPLVLPGTVLTAADPRVLNFGAAHPLGRTGGEPWLVR
jgi:hypothetical protein